MMGLTARQTKLLDFIRDRVQQDGFAPSYADMAAHLELKSKSGICRMVEGLEARGAVRRISKRARSIEVVDRRCPNCGCKL